jgi:molecular chaperone GrpE
MPEEKTYKVTDRRTSTREEDAAPEPEVEDRPSYVRQLEDRAARAEEQLKQYIRAYKEEVEVGLARTKERLQREAERELQRARGDLAVDLIAALDGLDRSIAAVVAGTETSAVAEGLRLVKEQFLRALQGLGITLVAPTGEVFDPRFHEAAGLQPVSDPAEDGKILAVLRPGYLLGDRVLRAPLVQVGRLMS